MANHRQPRRDPSGGNRRLAGVLKSHITGAQPRVQATPPKERRVTGQGQATNQAKDEEQTGRKQARLDSEEGATSKVRADPTNSTNSAGRPPRDTTSMPPPEPKAVTGKRGRSEDLEQPQHASKRTRMQPPDNHTPSDDKHKQLANQKEVNNHQPEQDHNKLSMNKPLSSMSEEERRARRMKRFASGAVAVKKQQSVPANQSFSQSTINAPSNTVVKQVVEPPILAKTEDHNKKLQEESDSQPNNEPAVTGEGCRDPNKSSASIVEGSEKATTITSHLPSPSSSSNSSPNNKRSRPENDDSEEPTRKKQRPEPNDNRLPSPELQDPEVKKTSTTKHELEITPGLKDEINKTSTHEVKTEKTPAQEAEIKTPAPKQNIEKTPVLSQEMEKTATEVETKTNPTHAVEIKKTPTQGAEIKKTPTQEVKVEKPPQAVEFKKGPIAKLKNSTAKHGRSAKQVQQKPRVYKPQKFAPVQENPEYRFKYFCYDDNKSLPILWSDAFVHTDTDEPTEKPSLQFRQEALALMRRALNFNDLGRKDVPKVEPTRIIDDCDLYLRDSKVYVATERGLLLAADYLKLLEIPDSQPVRFNGRKPTWIKKAEAGFHKRLVIRDFEPVIERQKELGFISLKSGNTIEVLERIVAPPSAGGKAVNLAYGIQLEDGATGLFSYDNTCSMEPPASSPLIKWTTYDYGPLCKVYKAHQAKLANGGYAGMKMVELVGSSSDKGDD